MDWKKLLDGAVEQIGEGAKAASDSAREAADSARKVAGIGIGEISVKLEGRAHLGGTLRGTVRLSLPEPIEGKRLIVSLRATRVAVPMATLAGRRGKSLERQLLFNNSVTVCDAMTFDSGEHTFEIEVPDAEPETELSGPLGDIVRAAQTLKSMTERPIQWSLRAAVEIPWKRNLQTETQIVIDAAPAHKPEPQSPPPKREPRKAPPIPRPVSLPAGFGEALNAGLDDLRHRGWDVVHRFVRPPVAPSDAMSVMAQHPDLEPSILQFYGAMDGLEVIVARPLTRDAARDTYAALLAMAARHDGALLGCDDLAGNDRLFEAVGREIGSWEHDRWRTLEIPRLVDLMSESETFSNRDGRPSIYGSVIVSYGEYFGVTRSDEIRSWRQPKSRASGRPGYYDGEADTYQAALTAREASVADRWWAVRGSDHGACLVEPAWLLRWPEMLAACIEHLCNA